MQRDRQNIIVCGPALGVGWVYVSYDDDPSTPLWSRCAAGRDTWRYAAQDEDEEAEAEMAEVAEKETEEGVEEAGEGQEDEDEEAGYESPYSGVLGSWITTGEEQAAVSDQAAGNCERTESALLHVRVSSARCCVVHYSAYLSMCHTVSNNNV